MATAPVPEGYEELEVEIVKEAWNTYDLEDGTRIRARSILTKVHWPKAVQQPVKGQMVQLAGSVQNLIIVFAPAKLRGAPNPNPPPAEVAQSMDSEEVAIVDSKEEWSIYRLPGNRGGLKVRLVVSSVMRVRGLYDREGSPYYVVSSIAAVGPATPREIDRP